ncbi:MAG: sulfate respiration complex protein HmcD [bacterium]
MHTLYDFVTHIKGVEYLIMLGTLAVFILFWEILKPRPFHSMANAGQEDLSYVRQTGFGNVFKTVGRIAAAPFIGIAYVVSVPFAFFFALFLGVIELLVKGANGLMAMLGTRVSFEWRPMEAYFTGKRKKKGALDEKK